MVTENERVLATVAALHAGRVAEIGPLLSASHASMRDDFEITVPQVDVAAATAEAAGALGARMTGGGFGGCVLALVAGRTGSARCGPRSRGAYDRSRVRRARLLPGGALARRPQNWVTGAGPALGSRPRLAGKSG